MEYVDVVYGRAEIGQPVLRQLMRSGAVSRLHRVLQHGISGLVGVTSPVTRFEHSVGVMLLVRFLGGSLEEQIAALLHDVSHTAFSHVIDYVFDGHDSQSYHDEVKEEYVANTDIPSLLAHHGYDWRDFLDERRYPLLEQEAPALCADRLDYFLRDSLDLGLANPEQVRQALGSLTVYDGRIVVDELKTAVWLARTYLAADEASWANFREVGLYELTARAIRTGLDIGAIGHQDIWSGDEELWRKLHEAPSAELQEQLDLVSEKTGFVWDEKSPDFRVSTKLRTIDPDVLADGRLQLLSQLDPRFARERDAYLERKQGKWPMRVIRPR